MKLCAVQPHMSDSIDENIRVTSKWIHRAAESGANVVVFPEMMLTGYDQHLHRFFKISGWYAQVEEALRTLSGVALEAEISVLVGSPYRISDGYLNALVLLQDGAAPILAGGRTELEENLKTRWGLVEAENRTPAEIQDIAFGSVFCHEAFCLDATQGKGIEKSDVILWPSGTINSEKNERNEITTDNSRIGARKIARCYGVPVIQANYISHATEETSRQAESWGYAIGGSVVCDAEGRILDQASRTNEEMLLIDITRNDNDIIVTTAGSSTDRGHGHRWSRRGSDAEVNYTRQSEISSD